MRLISLFIYLLEKNNIVWHSSRHRKAKRKMEKWCQLKWTKVIRCCSLAVYRLVFIFSNNLKKIRQDIRVLKDIFDLEGYFFMNEIYSVKIWNKFWWMNYSTSCHESVSCFRSFLYFNDIFRTIEEHMFILCSNIFCD